MRNPYLAAALSSIGRGAALKVQIDPSSSEISQPRATARTNRGPMQPAHPGLTGFLESGYRAPIGQEAQPAVNGYSRKTDEAIDDIYPRRQCANAGARTHARGGKQHAKSDRRQKSPQDAIRSLRALCET
jgi:hypothetical protein